jgi:hypothetical protein
MTNYTPEELADGCVKAGVGRFNDLTGKYYPPGAPEHQNYVGYMAAGQFTSDGRVVLALMELALKADPYADLFTGWCGENKEWVTHFDNYDDANKILTNQSPAIAIVEACLKALGVFDE